MKKTKRYKPGHKFKNGVEYICDSIEHSNSKNRYCWFICPLCGNDFVTRLSRVEKEHTSACGCYRTPKKNNYTIKGDITEIELQDGTFTIIDTENVEKCKKRRWSVNRNGYVRSSSFGEHIFLHAFIKGISPNSNLTIDHIDGNPRNNTKKNLNLTTNNKNVQKGNHKPGKTGYRRVFKRKNGTYRAGCCYENKMSFIGTYTDPIQAALAVDYFAQRIFGEDAYLNRNHHPEIMEAYQTENEDFKKQKSFAKKYQEIIVKNGFE